MGAKGQPKTGGRKKGAGNKISEQAREQILALEPIDNIERLIQELEDPKDQIDSYLRLLPFAVPRLAASQVDLKAALMGSTDLHVHAPAKKK